MSAGYELVAAVDTGRSSHEGGGTMDGRSSEDSDESDPERGNLQLEETTQSNPLVPHRVADFDTNTSIDGSGRQVEEDDEAVKQRRRLSWTRLARGLRGTSGDLSSVRLHELVRPPLIFLVRAAI